MISSILQDAAAGRAFIKPWTVDEYHWAIEHGMLQETPAYELLDGFIVAKDRARDGEDPMTIGDRHALVVQRLVRLAQIFDSHGTHLRIQQPFSIPPHNEPEPDAAVVRGSEDDYASARPEAADVFAVIEVADSSLSRDLGAKLRTYAAAGIAQYIVVDLVNNVVLVHESPAGGTYPAAAEYRAGAALTIRTGGPQDVSIPADRLLP